MRLGRGLDSHSLHSGGSTPVLPPVWDKMKGSLREDSYTEVDEESMFLVVKTGAEYVSGDKIKTEV